MGVVRVGMSTSLDGFVADRNGSAAPLYPDLEELRYGEAVAEEIETTGAVLMGRRSYEMGDTDQGFVDYEFQVPIFVLTHRVPEAPAKHDPAKGLTFTFVTDGIESAVEQASAAAGEKDVTVVGGASTVQQLLAAGLADELQISFVPLLLGEGLRMFENVGSAPRRLERIKVIEGPLRTDVRYRILG